MCDETFSINCSVVPPEGVDRGWFMFFVTLLNQVYWVAGAAIGALHGLFILFNTTGIEFVMTALFIVMLSNQWEASKDNFPAIAGLAATFICLLIFGQDNFMIPAMISIVAVLTLARGREEQLYDNDNN